MLEGVYNALTEPVLFGCSLVSMAAFAFAVWDDFQSPRVARYPSRLPLTLGLFLLLVSSLGFHRVATATLCFSGLVVGALVAARRVVPATGDRAGARAALRHALCVASPAIAILSSATVNDPGFPQPGCAALALSTSLYFALPAVKIFWAVQKEAETSAASAQLSAIARTSVSVLAVLMCLAALATVAIPTRGDTPSTAPKWWVVSAVAGSVALAGAAYAMRGRSWWTHGASAASCALYLVAVVPDVHLVAGSGSGLLGTWISISALVTALAACGLFLEDYLATRRILLAPIRTLDVARAVVLTLPIVVGVIWACTQGVWDGHSVTGLPSSISYLVAGVWAPCSIVALVRCALSREYGPGPWITPASPAHNAVLGSVLYGALVTLGGWLPTKVFAQLFSSGRGEAISLVLSAVALLAFASQMSKAWRFAHANNLEHLRSQASSRDVCRHTNRLVSRGFRTHIRALNDHRRWQLCLTLVVLVPSMAVVSLALDAFSGWVEQADQL